MKTIDEIMLLVDQYADLQEAVAQTTDAIVPRNHARAAVVAALREALTEPKVEKKTMSKAFCNPSRFDGEDIAYNNDYLNE